MRIHHSIFFSCLMAAITVPPANAASCMMADLKFVCADGSKELKDIAEAMADAETAKNIAGIVVRAELFPTRMVREDYRKSLEKNRLGMRVYADKMFRQYRRKKITAENYEKIRANFDTGMKNYYSAMAVYHGPTWYKK